MQNKRILHVITTIERGGAENQLLVLVKQQIKMGFEIVVFFLKGRPDLLEDLSRLGVVVVTPRNSNFLWRVIDLRKLIKAFHPNIVHAHLPRAEIAAALGTYPQKFIASRHNAEPFFPSAPKSISSLLSRLTLTRSSFVICITGAVRDFLINQDEIRDNSRLRIIYYGYEFEEIEPYLNKGVYPLSLLCIGRLVDQKDFPTLLYAMKHLRENDFRFRLNIAGEGKLFHRLMSLTRYLRLEDSVHFLGKVADVGSLFRATDFLVLASKYEGFGQVLLEAMNFQIPVIASRTPAAVEVLGDDYVGFFTIGNSVDLSNKIRDYKNISSLCRKQMLVRRELFEASNMALKIAEVYDS